MLRVVSGWLILWLLVGYIIGVGSVTLDGNYPTPYWPARGWGWPASVRDSAHTDPKKSGMKI